MNTTKRVVPLAGGAICLRNIMEKVSLVKEDDTLFIRWQMPVETLIKYRHVLAECASVLKCNEEDVPNKIQKLISCRDELLQKIKENPN